jgi:hypothetical protein
MVDIRKIVLERLAEKDMSRFRLTENLRGRVPPGPIYAFLAGKSRLNSSAMGIVLHHLQLAVVPREQLNHNGPPEIRVGKQILRPFVDPGPLRKSRRDREEASAADKRRREQRSGFVMPSRKVLRVAATKRAARQLAERRKAGLYTLQDLADACRVKRSEMRVKIQAGHVSPPTRPFPGVNGRYYNATEFARGIKQYKAGRIPRRKTSK